MSLWPFGTSRKDRKRIDALECALAELRRDMNAVTGPRRSYGYGMSGDPVTSLSRLHASVADLEKADRDIMEAIGLERVTVLPRSYITKKARK